MAHYITDAEGKLHKIAGNFNPSYQVSQLVKEKIAVGGEPSITIDGLNMLADGNTYDFEISCPSSSPNIWMIIGSDGGYATMGMSGNWNGATVLTGSARAQQGVLVANVYNGCMFVSGTIKQHSNFKVSVNLLSQSGNTSGASDTRNMITWGYFNNSSNVTSIKFLASESTYGGSTFKAGTVIRIYKKIVSATSIDGKLVADPITAGATLTHQNDTVIESYVSSDGNTWYRKWASGWKECGGRITGVDGSHKVTFPLTFSNTNFTILKTLSWADSSGSITRGYFGFQSVTTNSAYTYSYTSPSGHNEGWYACGF